jgi:cytoskeleton protein RodZ
MMTAVALLLVGALLLIFFPFTRQPEVAAGAKSAALETSSQPAPAVPVLAVSTPPLAAQAATLTASDAASNTPELAQVAGSGATNGILVLKAQALSWVEVVDAAGVVQVRRNMAAGETVGVSGTLPLIVVVGRSDTTQVFVRGQVLDLLSIAKDNVARFEVK